MEKESISRDKLIEILDTRPELLPDHTKRVVKDKIVNQDVIVPSSFRRVSPQSELFFDNVTFQNINFDQTGVAGLNFHNCQAEQLVINAFAGTVTIRFANCKIKDLRIDSHNESTTIRIDGDKTNIQTCIILQSFAGLTLSGGEIKNIQLGKIISPDSASTTVISVKNLKTELLSIDNFNITSMKLEEMSGPLIVVKNTSILSLFLDKVHNGILQLSGSILNALLCSYTKELTLNLKNSEGKNFSLTNCSFRQIEFSGSGKWEISFATFLKETVECDRLYLKDFLLEGRLSFTHFQFKDLAIVDCVNKGNFQLFNCEVTNSLKIYGSSLGKSTWNNFSIPPGKLALIDSNIDESIFTNFEWNDYVLDEEWDALKHKSELQFKVSLREAYRQLKNNYTKQGNKIEALEFQRGEMRVHYYLVSKRKWRSWRDFGNFLIVGTNKWSSDFGQNIWRPFLCLFAFHLILFNCMLWFNNVGYRIALPRDWDCEASRQGFSLYFQTLLPTHHYVVKGYAGSDISIGGFWDVLMRVSAGYFIFYFITASRKYHS